LVGCIDVHKKYQFPVKDTPLQFPVPRKSNAGGELSIGARLIGFTIVDRYIQYLDAIQSVPDEELHVWQAKAAEVLTGVSFFSRMYGVSSTLAGQGTVGYYQGQ
jgi:hypothetical protein